MDPAFKIREALPGDAEAIARVHVDVWRTTYPGLMPDAFLQERTGPGAYEAGIAKWKKILGNGNDREFAFVTTDAKGEIVGFASGGPERGRNSDFKGELYTIYILPSQQGKGIGRCLVRAVVSRLLREGFPSMLVWVLRDNPYRRFYERLGGRAVGEKSEKVGDSTLTETGYGWTDLGGVAKCA